VARKQQLALMRKKEVRKQCHLMIKNYEIKDHLSYAIQTHKSIREKKKEAFSILT
jgi:hypothetical protein